MRFLFVALLLASCTSIQYGYQPVGKDEILVAGELGAIFPLAEGDSRANLRVMSLGIMELKLGKNKPCRALHLRLSLTNEKGTRAWTLHASDQKVQIEGRGTSIPAYVKSVGLNEGLITIPPGKTRQVELFYPLPADRQSAQTFDGFDFHWVASIGNTPFEKTIPFVRNEADRSYASVEVNMQRQHQNMVLDEQSMGPGMWWYNSQYPGGAFMGVPSYYPQNYW